MPISSTPICAPNDRGAGVNLLNRSATRLGAGHLDESPNIESAITRYCSVLKDQALYLGRGKGLYTARGALATKYPR